jgi:hypothetical protein
VHRRSNSRVRRSGTSFAGGEGQRSFAHGFGRKEQRLADVVRLEVWAQGEDTLRGLAVSHEGNDSRNWNPKTAKARNSPIWRGLEAADLRKTAHRQRVRPRCEVPSATRPKAMSFTASPYEFERLDPCC